MRNAKGVSGKAVHGKLEGGCLLVRFLFEGPAGIGFPFLFCCLK